MSPQEHTENLRRLHEHGEDRRLYDSVRAWICAGEDGPKIFRFPVVLFRENPLHETQYQFRSFERRQWANPDGTRRWVGVELGADETKPFMFGPFVRGCHRPLIDMVTG